EGFIRISPQQGAVVRELSVHEIADQYEIRTALETFVVRSLAGRLTPEQTGRVQSNLEEQKANLEVGDVARAVALDEEFHALFGTFLGNLEIIRVMSHLRSRIYRVIFQVFKRDPGRMATSFEEHQGIAEAVIGGDAALAALRVEKHLRIGRDSLLKPRPF